jgi:hypothetical protein
MRNVSDYSSFATRVYCFISRFPFFKLHYDIILSILGKLPLHSLLTHFFKARERLYILEETQEGLDSLLRRQSEKPPEEDESEKDSDNNPSKQENEILSLLQSYYTQRVPRSGESMRFKLPGEVHSLEFTCPVSCNSIYFVVNFCYSRMQMKTN